VNPQTLGLIVVESAANTFTQAEVGIPVLRTGISATRAQVIEALWVEWQVPAGSQAAADGVDMQLTTSSQAALVTLNDPDILARYSDVVAFTTSGATRTQLIVKQDLTDGAGHGLIVATNAIFIGVIGSSQSGALTARCRLAYRFKNVSLQEFIGLSIQQS